MSVALCGALVGCRTSGAGADTDTTGAEDVTTSTQGSSGGGGSSTTTEGADTGSETTAGPGSSSSSTGDVQTGSSTGEPGDDGPVPELPTADGRCPAFVAGDLEFFPAETGPRTARVFYDADAGGGGPLVFWFHGTGGTPNSATNSLTSQDLDAIVAMGGMVVAPWNDPDTGQFPWFLVDENREDDLHLMDEIVACAAAGPGIDARRIHAAGFSAGGMHVSQAAFRRASYLASTATISGGLRGGDVPSDAPEQVVSSMILHGGASDDVAGFNFMEASEAFQEAIEARGGYALVCDHGGGHSVPSERGRAWEFMQAHPFGTDPSPLVAELPGWVPASCQP